MGLVQGKTALVTGAAAGIGRATALKFASESARVVVSDVDEAGGEETVRLITASGGEAILQGRPLERDGRLAWLITRTDVLSGPTKNSCGTASDPELTEVKVRARRSRYLFSNMALWCAEAVPEVSRGKPQYRRDLK